MSRRKRIWYEGACFHVMGRGNRRGIIFKEEEDYYLFLNMLSIVQDKFPFKLHAYCLMTNHFHLELTTGTDPIWQIMQRLMNNYARTFNSKYGINGHLFDSRYTSCLIENEPYFLEVSRYIHLNPVKAAMVREPLAYKYSSYKNYVSSRERPFYDKIDKNKVLSAFTGTPDEKYRNFVEGKISHAEQELLIQKDMKEDDMWLP